MTVDESQRPRQLRWTLYLLLMITSAGAIAGRTLAVSDQNGTTPFLSANDRSRWAAIRALGDHGSFEIDEIIREVHPVSGRRPWHSIDRVRHRGWDGREHDYSSKPPLLGTLLAGEYWVVKQFTGASVAERPFLIGRIMLMLSNLLPLIVFWWVLAKLVERLGVSDWGRGFTMAVATWGTFLSTFAITINNHLPAAVSVLLATYYGLRIFRLGRWNDDEPTDWRHYAAAGFFAAFAVTNELPALSLFALLGAMLLWKSPMRTIIGYAPAAAVVAAAFWGTNYWAHGTWRPPYTFRSDGPVLTTVEAHNLAEIAYQMDSGRVPGELAEATASIGISLSRGTKVTRPRDEFRWVIWDLDGQDRLAVILDHDRLLIRDWANWYEYPGSYWTEGQKSGIDQGEPSRVVYALHVLIGHHGIFSLTPVWLLSVVGGVVWWRRQSADSRGAIDRSGVSDQRTLTIHRGFVAAAALLSFVCVAFYIARPLVDRNYGGVTSGLRWTFWLIPLWLICLLPGADAIADRPWLRRVAYLLLLISVVSTAYPALNPWQHPWMYQWMMGE
ncbi:MAG: hypothetical protein KDA59_06150 [Planctomycetales bacterium]|nr:hypothetical protein [Planctomycetales bacterium]MCA9202604.1 hypothetical protein [Planctomycetales bacterium]MCA9223716.1 hypothetical protein [Planctomycetales bacterium]